MRFISEQQLTELLNLYHLARVNHNDKHGRMVLACKWFHDNHPKISSTAAYKDLSDHLKEY